MTLFLLSLFRKRQLEYNMMKMTWKISIAEIELQKSRSGVGSRVRDDTYVFTPLMAKTGKSLKLNKSCIVISINVSILSCDIQIILSVYTPLSL